MVERAEWLIRKDGYFYRPNCQGYTTHKHEAGRYTKEKAEAEASIEPWHMKAIHEDEWPDDAVSTNYKDKDARIAELAAENERLKKEVADANADRDRWYESSFRATTLASTGSVKVKALEWTRGWMNAEAQTEIGQYTITYRRDGSFEWGIGILKGWASSWDEAKAAAQADFERRVLSAIDTHQRAANTVVAHETANVSDKPEGQQEPVAVIEFARGKTGNENEMPRVISCNWLPDGHYEVFTRPSEQAVTEAAGPFVTFANHAIEKTDDGWVWRTSSNERICDWFGPSDFGALKAAMEAEHERLKQ